MRHAGCPPDVAQIRFDNALLLFDEFVRATVKDPDAATLRGLERRFAERLQIQPSYWSQIKGRSRQIGERLARQFEQLCHKPPRLDGPAARPRPEPPAARRRRDPTARGGCAGHASENLPQDDDERFIVGLVLTYYRRHPQRARTRLLDLLGEVLTTAPGGVAQRSAAREGHFRQGRARRTAHRPLTTAANSGAHPGRRCAAETKALTPSPGRHVAGPSPLAQDNEMFIICASLALRRGRHPASQPRNRVPMNRRSVPVIPNCRTSSCAGAPNPRLAARRQPPGAPPR